MKGTRNERELQVCYSQWYLPTARHDGSTKYHQSSKNSTKKPSGGHWQAPLGAENPIAPRVFAARFWGFAFSLFECLLRGRSREEEETESSLRAVHHAIMMSIPCACRGASLDRIHNGATKTAALLFSAFACQPCRAKERVTRRWWKQKQYQTRRRRRRRRKKLNVLTFVQDPWRAR